MANEFLILLGEATSLEATVKTRKTSRYSANK